MDMSFCFFDEAKNQIIDVVHPITRRSFYANETIEQMRLRYPKIRLRDITTAALLYEESFKTDPVETTYENFNEMFEILPPVDYRSGANTESFKMRERMEGTITGIYARIGNRYFQFYDSIFLKHDEIIRRIQATL